jgi:hypothetical protein
MTPCHVSYAINSFIVCGLIPCVSHINTYWHMEAREEVGEEKDKRWVTGCDQMLAPE